MRTTDTSWGEQASQRRVRRSRIIALAIAIGIAATGTITLGAPAPAAYALTYPTWDDVKKARANVAAKEAELQRIESLLEQLQINVDTKDAEAQEAARIFEEADAAFVEAAQKAASLQAQADAAHAVAEDSRLQAGQMAAQLARQGGGDLSANLFVNSGEADTLLSKLGYASKLTEQSEGLYSKALQEMNSAQALTDQADVAAEERERLRIEAEQAMAAAQAAYDAAQAALVEQQEQQIVLEEQRRVLQAAEEVTEAQYAEGVRVREEEERRRRAAAAAAAQTSGGSVTSREIVNGWTWPASGQLMSGYGMRLHPIYGYWRMHNGQDVSNGAGTPIYAASAGRVVYSGYSSGFGNYVKIDHGNGMSSIYAHILSGGLRVSHGQQVSVGQLVGLMGSTGPSTGNHLHLEVRRDNVPINPLDYIRAKGVPVG